MAQLKNSESNSAVLDIPLISNMKALEDVNNAPNLDQGGSDGDDDENNGFDGGLQGTVDVFDDNENPVFGEVKEIDLPSHSAMSAPEYDYDCDYDYNYWTCGQNWDATIEELVIVKDESGHRLGTFPIAFLAGGAADTLTVGYLLKICKLTYEIPTSFELRLSDQAGLLDDNVDLGPGVYRLNGVFQPRPGPTGKTKSRPFRDTDSASTVSNSSRSSVNQSHFKLRLLQRDQYCLLSGEYELESLVACHIVPMSLGRSKLDEICGETVINLFATANGLLLARHFHNSFDRYEWSIYTFQGSYFVHVFGECDHELHGKQLQFRFPKKKILPNTKLLTWHYTQCLMARFRGSMARR